MPSDSNTIDKEINTTFIRNTGPTYLYGEVETSVSGSKQMSISDSKVTVNKLAIGLPALTDFSASATTGGSLGAGTYYYRVFSFDSFDHPGIPGPETAVVVGGANNAVSMSWTAVPGASYYRVGKGTIQGATVSYLQTNEVTFTDTGQSFIASNPIQAGSNEGSITTYGTIDLPSGTGAIRWYGYTTGTVGASISSTSAGEMDFMTATGSAQGNFIFLNQNEAQRIVFQTNTTSPVISFSGSGVVAGVIEADPLIFSIGGAERGRFTTTALTINPTSNQLILGATRTATINAPTPATTSRVYTFPDLSGDYSVVGTIGTQTISGVKTFDGQLIGKGTATNDDAAAGYIGEYIESVVSTLTNFPATTGNLGDATSISLTAGDWDVEFIVLLNESGGSLTTQMDVGISTTSGNSATGLTLGENRFRNGDNTVVISTTARTLGVPSYRMKFSGTTTVYGKLLGNYTVATPQFRCRLSARRAR